VGAESYLSLNNESITQRKLLRYWSLKGEIMEINRPASRGVRRAMRRLFITAVVTVLSAVPVLVGALPTASAATLPTWHFKVTVRMAQSTADLNGGLVFALSKTLTQMDTVNHRFNDPGVLKDKTSFEITTFDTYTDRASDELAKPHPAGDFLLIYDENANTGGGWLGDRQAIVHKWPTLQGGSFAPDATDGLVHEFGHSREATDEYACDVDTNPVNGAGYHESPSIMSYPYGVRNWSAYSVGLINADAGTVNTSSALASRYFPPVMRIRALSSTGSNVSHATVTLYPVKWFSLSVTSTPALSGYTDSSGYYKFSSNPFGPGAATPRNPWDLAYCNFLVKVTSGKRTAYQWMSLPAVGSAYFKNPTGTYTLNVKLP